MPKQAKGHRILIRDALVLSLDPSVGDRKRASILIEGERIAAIGTRSIGLEQRIGGLTPGKQADILLLRVPPLVALNDPYGTVAPGAHAGLADTVIAAGAVRKRAGRLCGVDLERCSAELAATSQRLFERAGFAPPVGRLQ